MRDVFREYESFEAAMEHGGDILHANDLAQWESFLDFLMDRGFVFSSHEESYEIYINMDTYQSVCVSLSDFGGNYLQ